VLGIAAGKNSELNVAVGVVLLTLSAVRANWLEHHGANGHGAEFHRLAHGVGCINKYTTPYSIFLKLIWLL
jgi:hypothetical protein